MSQLFLPFIEKIIDKLNLFRKIEFQQNYVDNTILMQANLEEHPDVKTFLNKENPTVDIIAKAYFARDNIMNLDFNNLKQQHIEKLGYTDERIKNHIRYKVKNHLYSLVDKFLEEPLNNEVNYNFLDESNKIMASEKTVKYIKTRKERYTSLSAISDHLQFYQSLTQEELYILGW